MQNCEFCGTELPTHAHFCGNCGRVVSNAMESPTAASDISTIDWVTPNTPPINNPPLPFVQNMRTRQEDEDSTIRTDWLEKGMIENKQVSEESQTLRPDLLLPGMIRGNVQGFGGDVPMVQGTPQAGGVPTVQGTPPGLSAPPHLMPNPQTPPLHLAARTPFPQEVHTPHHHLHAPQQHHLVGRAHEHNEANAGRTQGPLRPHTTVSRLVAGSRKLMIGTTTKWFIVVVAAIVVGVTSGVFAVIALNPSPTLSLSGSSNVVLGGVLSLHGSGFSPGASVTLTLDHGLPLSSAGRPNIVGAGVYPSWLVPTLQQAATTSLLLSAGQAKQSTSSNAPGTTLHADSSGTFDIQIVVQRRWSPGQHTLQARETSSSKSATLTFNVVAKPAKLSVNPFALDFGSLEVNSKVFQSIVIMNSGEQTLAWTADTGGTQWLKVLGSTGAIESKGPQEFVYVMADTSHLSVGNYTATLTINSNGGKEQVGVKLSVVPSTVKQAKLSVNPPTLDFGQVPIDQQATLGLTVSNVGTQQLNWKADTGGTNWLSLDVSAGMINAGQQPHMIHVTVDATNLSLGNQSAVVQFNSNGGTTQVTITLDVTMRAKPPAPILTGNPNGFSIPGDSNCTYDANSGWTCMAALSSYKTAQVNLDWTASSTGVSGVSFSPASGTLTPGQTAKVAISIPNTVCPTNADFMFTGPGNTLDLPWSCAATTLSASPSAFDANSDCTFSSGWTCFATLSSDQNAQGYLNWSASGSDIKGISFSPSSGSLAPGQKEQVTISIPNTACPATANFNFSGQQTNSVTVPWGCMAPTLVISKTNFNANTDCTFNNGWTCNETLSLGSKAPGDPNLNWSTSSNGINGIKFSPPGGTLSVGQTTEVTITIPNTACPASASLSFAGQNSNTAMASWSCSPVSFVPSKTSFNGNTDCTYDSHNGWTCTETLSLSSNNPGDPSLNWSASGSGINGITFSPPNGTLSSGQTTTVTITVPPTACPASASLSFAAQNANTATISWSCSPVTLQVSKTTMSGSDCSYDSTNGWTCTEALSLSSNNPGDPSLNWSASSSGISGVSFSPSSGTVTSGQTSQVTITIPNTTCPSNATFTFTSPSNTVNVTWSCPAPHLSGSPGSFTANSDCSLANSTWTCMATVSSDANAQGGLSWSASSSGVNGITFSPANGVLSPGQSASVTITVPNTTCQTTITSATLTFTGPANMVSIPWKCNPPQLAVNQATFNIPDGNCSYSAGQGWTCTTMLTNQDRQQPLNWSATSSGVNGITINPPNGTLPPGQPASVSIIVPDITCPANATITFAGPANSVDVKWSCPAPMLTISPPGVMNCPQNSDGSWTCTWTLGLAQGSQGNLSWSPSSSLSGVTFTPSGGTLLSSSPSVSVSVNIPSNDCTPGTFTFAGQGQGANSVTASWSCTQQPSLVLTVSPSSFNSNNCSNNGSAWTCVATLNSSSSNTGNLNWSATSSMPSAVGFNPSNGTLSPGHSTQVTATIPVTCPANVTLEFVGPANTVNVPFSC